MSFDGRPKIDCKWLMYNESDVKRRYPSGCEFIAQRVGLDFQWADCLACLRYEKRDVNGT